MKFRPFLCAGIALLLTSIAVSGTNFPKPQSNINSMEAAKTIDAAALPQKVGPSAPAVGRFANLRPQNGLNDAQYTARKQQVAQRRSAAPSLRALAPNAAAPSLDTPNLQTNFDGINVDCAGVIPSDMGLAVGTTWVVQAVNDCFAVFNKSGALQAGFPKSLNGLFGLPANDFVNGVFVTDPRAFYDPVAGRFVIVALWEDLPNSIGYIYVASSATGDPSGTWHVYATQNWGSGLCPDFPAVGHGRYGDKTLAAIAVGVNLFACSPSGFGSYVDVHLTFLNKVALYKGVGEIYWFFFGFGGIDTIQPSNLNDKNEESRAIFALATFNINYGGGQCISGCSGLIVYAFDNVLWQGSNALFPESSATELATSTYSLPPNASQFFNANTIDTDDVRITGSVAYSHGKLWATINTDNGGGGPGILAWELHVFLDDNGTGRCVGALLNACPDLSGAAIDREMNYDVTPSGGITANAYYGTIYPDDAGNVTMVFNFSGYFIYAGTNFLSQRATFAPQATFHDGGQTLRNGLAVYPFGRWGDYTGATVDGTTVWFSGMYARSDGLWNTGIGKTGYSQGTQP